jgi:hypothetical protein
MFTFHPEVAKLFCAAGWAPERRVEVASLEKALSSRGLHLFPAAARILASVGGLTVRGPARAETRGYAREIAFDPLRGAADREQFEMWEQLAGRRLCPLAGPCPRLCLLVAEDGGLFAGQTHLFYRYGSTFEEAMALYFLGAQPVRCPWCD